MFCGSCGQEIPNNARFCQRCGSSVVLPSISQPNASKGTFDPQPQAMAKKHPILWVVGFGLLGLVVISHVLTDSKPNGSDQSTVGDLKSKPQPASINSQESQHVDTAVQAKAQKLLREKWARETQEALWKEGMEMTFQARDTTLYVHYVLAGDAFVFQFKDQFLHDNADILKTLGFKNVQLSNGDTVWTWKVADLTSQSAANGTQ